MRQTYYQAYQQLLESERGKIAKTIDIKNKQVKPYQVKKTVGKMNKPVEKVKVQEIRVNKTDAKHDQDNTIIKISRDGIAPNSKSKKFIRAKDLNAKYRGPIISPFYKETEGKCDFRSGIFSEDENSVCAAISAGVPTNKTVRSKLLSRKSYYDKGLGSEDFIEDVGQVDALTWQCWNGNSINVKQILKAGYDVPKNYSGMNPITAAVDGRNIECLKLVLSVPKIRDLVNKKDGFGNYPLDAVCKIRSIDPYEFAKILIEFGARDDNSERQPYSAAMLSLMNGGWTPNLFGELLPVTNLEYKGYGGFTLKELAERMGNREAIVMIENFKKFGDESINQSVTHSQLISHI